MTDFSPLTHKLPDQPLAAAVLGNFHIQIKLLLQRVIQGLLYESAQEDYFCTEVQPIIEGLLRQLQPFYGARHPGLQLSLGPLCIAAMLSLHPLLLADIAAALANDPATDDALEVIACYPGFKATCFHRLAHIFYQLKVPLLPRMIAELAHEMTGIDIHPGAQIGAQFFIDHGTGVVIGESAVIGQGVTLYQGVTLGAKRFYRDESGQLIKGQARHPIIGDQVTIYAGATILGRITIGANSTIGGNVWLTESIPAHSHISQQRHRSSSFMDGAGI